MDNIAIQGLRPVRREISWHRKRQLIMSNEPYGWRSPSRGNGTVDKNARSAGLCVCVCVFALLFAVALFISFSRSDLLVLSGPARVISPPGLFLGQTMQHIKWRIMWWRSLTMTDGVFCRPLRAISCSITPRKSNDRSVSSFDDVFVEM